MTYGLMADLHLHAWSSFSSTTPDGQNSRLVALLGEIRRCAETTYKAGGRTVVLAGDIFHVRGSIIPSVFNAAKQCLLECVEEFSPLEFVIIPGNHDLEGKESKELTSAVTGLQSAGITVISETARFSTNLVLVPWVEKIDDLKLLLLDCDIDNQTDVIIHAPIDGVITGLPDHGLTPEFLASLGAKRVFAGHYHNHKRFEGNVFSIGALAHHTWSDVGSKAGFLIVSDESVDWQKSHLPEFIDLSQLLDLEPSELPYLVDGNFIRVKVEASKTKDVEAARQELLDMGAAAVVVLAMPKPPVREGAPVRSGSASAESLETSISNFIKTMSGVSEAEVEKACFDVLAAVDSLEK